MNEQATQGDFARDALPLLGLFLCLIVAPYFYSIFFRDIFTLPKALPMAAGVALLWACVAYLRDSELGCSLTPAIKAMAAATVLSALFSVDSTLSILGPHQQQFYALLPLSLVLLAYYAAASQCPARVPSVIFVLFAISGGVAVSIPALLQMSGHFMPWSIQGGRAGSTFGSPIYLGGYLAMILPLAWALSRRPMITAAKVIAWGSFAVILAALLASKSRGAVAAAASGIILIEYLSERKRFAFLLTLLGASVFTVVMAQRAGTSHGSDVARIEIWLSALRAWGAHPLLGWGPDTFPIAFRQFMTARFTEANGSDIFIQLSAHNDLLQVLSTMGLIGLCAYLYLIKDSWRLISSAIQRGDEMAVWIAGALMAVFVQAKINPITLTSLAVAAILLGSLDREPREPSQELPPANAYAAAGASGLIIMVLAVMLTAERYQRLGENLNQMGRGLEAAEQFNRAAQTNPFTLYYSQRQLDYFWQMLPRVPGVNKRTLAEFSHTVSEHIDRLHPYDPTAHELRGMSYEFEAAMIGASRAWEADHEFAIAQRMAPGFSAYVKRRKALAQKSTRRQ